MAVTLEASPTTSSTGLVSMAALNAGAESEICFFDAGTLFGDKYRIGHPLGVKELLDKTRLK